MTSNGTIFVVVAKFCLEIYERKIFCRVSYALPGRWKLPFRRGTLQDHLTFIGVVIVAALSKEYAR